MPADWISISAVTRDPSTTFDSVDPDFSGVYCSSQCAVVARSIASTLAAKSIRPPELNIRDEVVETREMQATRIGLTVLDILDALFSQQLGAGAIIPLSAEYEQLPGTCLLTVSVMDEVDLPPEFQMQESANEDS